MSEIVGLTIEHKTLPGRKRTLTIDKWNKLSARSDKWRILERHTSMPGEPTKAEKPVTVKAKAPEEVKAKAKEMPAAEFSGDNQE